MIVRVEEELLLSIQVLELLVLGVMVEGWVANLV
jgi:hypothetical protein